MSQCAAIEKQKQLQLLTIHKSLGHTSFHIIRLLCLAGILQRELTNVAPPLCPGCSHGKANRRPWRQKGKSNLKKIKPVTIPGQIVSVDQLVSYTPGLIPTHRGLPTTKRYSGATIFVDHASDFTYVHLMKGTPDAEKTVEAAQAFERREKSHGVNIHHYHADNVLFDTFTFKAKVATSNQTMSFCGVNAHYQNGKDENRVKDVTISTSTSLLHAAHRWPNAIYSSLWPAAMKNYINLRQ